MQFSFPRHGSYIRSSMVLTVLIDHLRADLWQFLPRRCDKSCQMKKLIIIVAMALAVAGHKTKRRNSAVSSFDDYPTYPGGRQYPQYQTYRHRPYRQELIPHPEQLSFRHHSLPKTRSTLSEVPSVKHPASFFTDESPFVGQPNDRFPYPQSFREDYRFADLYDAIDAYKVPDQRHLDLGSLTRGNEGLGYVPMEETSPLQNGPAPKEKTTTTMAPLMSSTSSPSPLQQSTVSTTTPAISQVRASVTSESKMPVPKAMQPVTMSTGKSDTLANTATTGPPNPASVSTMTATSVTAKQFSNSTDSSSATTTVASLAVVSTESPIVSTERHPLYPIEFQAASHYIPEGFRTKLQQSFLDYLASQMAKGGTKTDEQTLQLHDVFPMIALNNSKIPVSGYSPYEESSAPSKSSLQSSLLNYFLQRQASRAPSFRPSHPTETVNYIPMASLGETRAKITAPGVPIAALSAVPRPLQTVNYRPATVPRLPAFVAQDSSTSPVIPLGTSLSSSFSSSLANGHVASMFNDLPGGPSRHLPVGLSSSLSVGPPTLNFGQNVHELGQLKQFGAAPSLPYSTGLQLQLDGFSDTDYTLRSANIATRSVDLGPSNVGLSLPELPRHQLTTFPKLGFSQQSW